MPTTMLGWLNGDESIDEPIYEARLDGETGEVLLSEGLLRHAPAPGTPVAAPGAAAVPFDLADPRSVFSWLRGSTCVLSVEGPDLLPPMPPPVPGVIY